MELWYTVLSSHSQFVCVSTVCSTICCLKRLYKAVTTYILTYYHIHIQKPFSLKKLQIRTFRKLHNFSWFQLNTDYNQFQFWWVFDRASSMTWRVKPTRCYAMVYWTLWIAQHVSGIPSLQWSATCWGRLYSRKILTMGIIMPEACWAIHKFQ